uniref:Tafazzin family protein n=1 Tax=Syphacia muris TaxID=451379 RepID=A0A0N5B1K3_9BILA
RNFFRHSSVRLNCFTNPGPVSINSLVVGFIASWLRVLFLPGMRKFAGVNAHIEPYDTRVIGQAFKMPWICVMMLPNSVDVRNPFPTPFLEPS